jgi:scyllo-inositol 2-dehydrogenase (NADP+)
MEKKIKTALASFGMSGLVFHGPMLKANPQFEVVKILERSKNVSGKLFPEATIVRTLNDILSDKSIELVFINTPDSFHFEMAKAAIIAGKHIVVEKPFTQTVSQAKELVQLAHDKGILLTVYQNRRWDGDFLTIRKILDEKMIGRLVEFESHYDRYRNYIAPNTWKEEGGEFGGALYNLGSHMVDQALVLFGKPKSITGHLDILRTSGKVTDYYDIRFQYKGFAATMKCSLLVRELGPRYIIHGTDGSFLKWGIDPQEEALKAGILPVGVDWGKEPETDWGHLNSEIKGVLYNKQIETIAGDYRLFYNNLYEAIRLGKELAVKPEEALLLVEMLNVCLESNRLKKTIEF